jgi:hypothetical protein
MNDKTNIVKFFPANATDNPDNVLEQAVGQYKDVLVLGWNEDGELCIRSTPHFEDGANILYMFELFKHMYFNGDFSG